MISKMSSTLLNSWIKRDCFSLYTPTHSPPSINLTSLKGNAASVTEISANMSSPGKAIKSRVCLSCLRDSS